MTIPIALATAAYAGACGSNDQHAAAPSSSLRPTSSAPPAPPAPPPAPPPTPDHIEGMITAVSGSTIDLRLRQGTGSVDFTPSTKVVESSPAQLSDVTPGSCVAAVPAPGSAPGSVTAKSVIVSSAIEGKCSPPVIPGGAAPAAPPSGPPAANSGVQGKVDTVSGNTISIVPEANGNTRTNVAVTDSTSYTKQAATDTEALTSGRCMSADGAKNDGGVIQAVTIDLQPCPPMGGRPHHTIPIPHLPHIPLPHHHR